MFSISVLSVDGRANDSNEDMGRIGKGNGLGHARQMAPRLRVIAYAASLGKTKSPHLPYSNG